MSNRIENAEVYDYGDEIAVSTPCLAGCDRGLFYAPAHFCNWCNGSGYVVRWFVPKSGSRTPARVTK